MDNKFNRVMCPFFKGSGKQTITCEGFNHNTDCKQRFSDANVKNEYEHEKCSTVSYRNCHYYRALALLYDRGIKQ